VSAHEAALIWLDHQGTTGAAVARLAITALIRENGRLQGEIEHLGRMFSSLAAGVPIGVTDEEWQIIGELRRVCG
jgi:hypothetical protein